MAKVPRRRTALEGGVSKNAFTAPLGQVTAATPLRVTSLQLLEECPRHWEAAHLRGTRQQRENGASQVGSWVHEVCERYLRGDWELGSAGADRDGARLIKLGVKAQEVKNLWTYLADLTSLRPHLLALEYEFNLSMIPEAPPIRGHIDAVFQTPHGLLVLDHKTNRRPQSLAHWQAKLQPAMYAWAARRVWGLPVIDVVIGYVNLGRLIKWRTYPTDDAQLLCRYRQLWKALQAYQRDRHWPARLNDGCRFCHLKAQCPAFRRQADSFVESLNLDGLK